MLKSESIIIIGYFVLLISYLCGYIYTKVSRLKLRKIPAIKSNIVIKSKIFDREPKRNVGEINQVELVNIDYNVVLNK